MTDDESLTVTVVQLDWDGKGNDRVHTYHPHNRNQLEWRYAAISLGFNLAGGRTKVKFGDEDVTQLVIDTFGID